MANYINKEILCEAYTHLSIEIFDDKAALDNLKMQLLAYFEERAKFLLGADVEVRIEFEEGSLRTKLQVIGSAGMVLLGSAGVATGAINAVVKYGDFRQGVDQLAADAASLAQGANLEVVFRTKADPCDRVTIEKRKGVLGRVSDLLASLGTLRAKAADGEFISSNIVLKSGAFLVEQLLLWDARTDRLFLKMDSSLTEECVAGGLLEEIRRMPKKLAWEKELRNHNFKSRLIDSDPLIAGKLEGVAAQYAATLQSIEKKLEGRFNAAHLKNSSN